MFKNFNKKTFKINISWLIFDKLFRATLNVILSLILARNLGPENFGTLNYLLALLFLFTSLSSLGINPILTNKIIKDNLKSNHKEIMNSYYTRFVFSIFCYFIFLLIIYFSNNDEIVLKYSIIIGIGIILKSGEIFFSFYEAKSLSKYIVISQSIGLITSLTLIIIIFLKNYEIINIYYALLIDLLIVFILVNYFYFLRNKISFPSINLSLLKNIIKKSFPVLISSLSIILYMRIDQIMIKMMMDEYQVGIYSASVRFIEIFHFMPKIIMISFLPILLRSKNYNYQLTNLNSIIFKISMIIMIIIFFGSNYLIETIYGKNYIESIFITKILCFSLIFVFFGVVNEHWYIKNSLQLNYAYNVFFGALLNVILNYILILNYGSIGAAISTIITYFFIIFIFDFFSFKTKKLLDLKVKSLFKV